MNVFYIFLIVVLVVLSIQDIKEQKISVILVVLQCLLAGVMGIVGIIKQEHTVISTLYMIIPGLLIILFAKLAEQSIGVADGVIVSSMGLALKIDEYIIAMLVTFGLMFLVAGFMLVVKKASRKTKMAMLPYISTGVVTGIIIGEVVKYGH